MLVTALALFALIPAAELRKTTWPSGEPREEFEVEVADDGSERLDGSYRSWHENGEPASTGSYSKGQRVGSWTFFHPNGQTAQKGRYVKGRRDGPWRAWNEEGDEEARESGTYTYETWRSEDGSRAVEGPRLDGLRHGLWTSRWPDGTPQLEAQFDREVPHGSWVFHHPDGRVAPLLSNRYELGSWAGELSAEEVAAQAVAPAGGGLPEAAWRDDRVDQEVARTLEEWLSLSPRDFQERWKRFAEEDRTAVPAGALATALGVLFARTGETPQERVQIGRLEQIALRPLCGSRSLGSFGVGGPPDAATAREFIESWKNLWAATRGDSWFWHVEVPHARLGHPDLLLRSPPCFYGASSVRPPEPWAARFGPREIDAREKALQAALDWLARNQLADGRWSSELIASGPSGGWYGFDVGVTGLALLAFLGSGQGPNAKPHGEVIARAASWLLSMQDPDHGVLTATGKGRGLEALHVSWAYEHAIATEALAELLALTRSTTLEPHVRQAVEVILAAQNPAAGWRYDAKPLGDSDTSVTAWMVMALRTAEEAGIAVDPAAYRGALAWFDKVTDRRTGRCGYQHVGETSSRMLDTNEQFPPEKGESLTAMALFCRFLLGQDPADEVVMRQHAELLHQRLPEWSELAVDAYYWHFASLAVHQLGESQRNEAWQAALEGVVGGSQIENGPERGSWDPIGVWDFAGGRVYSTAMSALCLESRFRYARLLEER